MAKHLALWLTAITVVIWHVTLGLYLWAWTESMKRLTADDIPVFTQEERRRPGFTYWCYVVPAQAGSAQLALPPGVDAVQIAAVPTLFATQGQVRCGVLHLRYWGNSDPLARIHVGWHWAGEMRRDLGLAEAPCLEMK